MTTEENAPLSARRKSRPVHVGDVQVGGDAPVVVQTMTNTDTADADATIEQIARLADCGAEIVRRGRRIAPEKEALVHLVGLALIITSAIVITYFDVIRLIRGDSLFR